MRTIAFIFKVILGLCCVLLVACQAEQEPVIEKIESAKVTATAELISLKNATIGPPNISNMWQYKIQKMTAENTLVKKGDVILVFDGDRVRSDLVNRRSRLEAEIKKAESNKLKDDATTQNLILKLAEAEMEYNKAKRKAEIVDESSSKIERLKQQADFRYQTEGLAQAKQKLAHHKKAHDNGQWVRDVVGETKCRYGLYAHISSEVDDTLGRYHRRQPLVGKHRNLLYVSIRNLL